MKPRRLAPWLDPDAVGVLRLAIVQRALLDVGLCETPPGSNRGIRIDEYVQAVKSPLGSPWCAAAVAAWLREAGAKVPLAAAGSCDIWMAWAHTNKTWRGLDYRPEPGDVVVYGARADANHIGVVVRTTPRVLSVEGNTSLDRYEREGWIVTARLVQPGRVLGYIVPVAAPTYLRGSGL